MSEQIIADPFAQAARVPIAAHLGAPEATQHSRSQRLDLGPKNARAGAAAYIDLRVGQFYLALRADHVVGVHAADSAAAIAITGGTGRVPYCHLADLFELTRSATGNTQPPSSARPATGPTGFVVVVEGEVAMMRAAVGVDAVGHMHGLQLQPSPLPPLHLRHPTLFEGAARHGTHLLLLLAPIPLGRFVRTRPRSAPSSHTRTRR